LQIRRCAASQLRYAVEDHRVFREADGPRIHRGSPFPSWDRLSRRALSWWACGLGTGGAVGGVGRRPSCMEQYRTLGRASPFRGVRSQAACRSSDGLEGSRLAGSCGSARHVARWSLIGSFIPRRDSSWVDQRPCCVPRRCPEARLTSPG
jgi:hypothetical protein